MKKEQSILHLAWLESSINSTLQEGLNALEKYSLKQERGHELDNCIKHLQSISKILAFTDSQGLRIFSTECEALAKAISQQKVIHLNDALTTLMQALLQLPLYIQHIKDKRSDEFTQLIPVLNDLRGARNSRLFSESNVFDINLEQGLKKVQPKVNPKEHLSAELHKQLFYAAHNTLSAIFSDKNTTKNLRFLRKILLKLESGAEQNSFAQLWHLSTLMLDCLIKSKQTLRPALKMVLASILKQIKLSLAKTQHTNKNNAQHKLIKNILFYINYYSKYSAQARSLCKHFDVPEISYDNRLDSSKGFIDSAVLTVSSLLLDDLKNIIEKLEALNRKRKPYKKDSTALLAKIESFSCALLAIGLSNDANKLNISINNIKNDHSTLKEEFAALIESLVIIEGKLIELSNNPSEYKFDSSDLDNDIAESQITSAQKQSLGECQRLSAILLIDFQEMAQNGFQKQAVDKWQAVLLTFLNFSKLLPYPAIPKLLKQINNTPSLFSHDIALSETQSHALETALESLSYYLDCLSYDAKLPDTILSNAIKNLRKVASSKDKKEKSAKENTTKQTIDAEIIEIFSEELTEVLETLKEQIPIWRQDNNNNKALTEIRRAFHTLKGSGRTVGAYELGELSWSIENMVNRVIDKSIVVENKHFDLIDQVVPQFLPMFKLFEKGEDVSNDEQIKLRTIADAYAKGEETKQSIETKEKESKAIQDADNKQIVDPEFIEIFSEELTEVLETLKEQVPIWRQDNNNNEALTEVRRSFHTLKGSGRTVGAYELGELSWSIENMLNRIIDKSIVVEDKHFNLIDQVVPQFLPMFKLFEKGEDVSNDEQIKLRTIADAYAKGEEVQASDDSKESKDVKYEDISPDLLAIFIDEAENNLKTIATYINSKQHEEIDDDLLRATHSLVGASKMANLGEIAAPIEALDKLLRSTQLRLITPSETTLKLITQVHTRISKCLEDSSQGNFDSLGHLQKLTETIINEFEKTEKHAELISTEDQPAISEFLSYDFNYIYDADEILGNANDKPDKLSDLATEIHNIYQQTLTHHITNLIDLSGALAKALTNINKNIQQAHLDILQRGFFALVDCIDYLAMGQMVDDKQDLINEISNIFDKENAKNKMGALADQDISDMDITPDDDIITTDDLNQDLLAIFLEEAVEILEESNNALFSWRENPEDLSHIEALQRALHTLKGGARMAELKTLGNIAHELESLYESHERLNKVADASLFDMLEYCHDELEAMIHQIINENCYLNAASLLAKIKQWQSGEYSFVKDTLMTTDGASSAKKTLTSIIEISDDNVDINNNETFDFFIEEAVELTEQLEASLYLWQKEPNNLEHIDKLKRILHTLKGGARMVGYTSLGTFCHHFEDMFNNLAKKGIQPDSNLINDAFVKADVIEQFLTQIINPQSAKKEDKQTARSIEQKTSKKTRPQLIHQESVKISTSLLENLINLAGEASINRGRIEKQIFDSIFILDDMHVTIERLRNQLRQLELETEAQILSRYEPVHKRASQMDFDPLELDKYSKLNQLSRFISETTVDLVGLKDTLVECASETESILTQQERINRTLQEDLTHTRMVPFSRSIPRLRKIIRQVSKELGKPVELKVVNAEGEMDRAVLERLIAPLEHMIRNAIAHGIEDVATRKKRNKPATGIITITFSREGPNILLAVADDGGGIDPEKVRKKALTKQLIGDDENITDNELIQLVLKPGFSTAEKVSQISGRGVGMDVVVNELDSLEGSINVRSSLQVGSIFELRIPFTVSVNRSLMVKLRDEEFAIPLSCIEGLLRVNTYEAEAYFEQDSPKYEYAGISYDIIYLGRYIHGHDKPDLSQKSRSIPLLLTRFSDRAVAIAVDVIIGNREIVSKSVGTQLNNVPAVSGATIMGDGSVIYILDPISLLRAKQNETNVAQLDLIEPKQTESQQAIRVMVVDDSVTVRKVTERILGRHEMEVITAKDGVDAVSKLQDIIPDVMLLDIEMPKMDGFELATLIRGDEALQHLPIIMITSRSGEKHKKHAFEIGVNEYIGKPFNEDEIIELIHKYTTNNSTLSKSA